MKYATFFLLALFISTLKLSAQSDSLKQPAPIRSENYQKWMKKEPGVVLQHAGYLGLAGFGTMLGGSYIVYKAAVDKSWTDLRGFGFAVIGASFGLQIAAWIDFVRAGAIMEDRKMGVYSSFNGVGLRYRF